MKIHPLFDAALMIPMMNGNREAWANWERAGKPVVEEPRFPSIWDPPGQGVIYTIHGECREVLAAKDAKIKELEERLRNTGDLLLKTNQATAESSQKMYQDQIKELEAKLAEVQSTAYWTTPTWNAALEEAAVMVERAGLHPDYKRKDDEILYQAITNVHEFAARIRGLKK